jgi:hypothetical protein
MNICMNHKAHKVLISAIILLFVAYASSCDGGTDIKKKILLLFALSSPAPVSVSCSGNCLVSWNANHEKAVNSTNGGYRLYYSQDSHFQKDDTGVQMFEVPYVLGPTAPTSVIHDFGEGTWYIRITAYSSFNESDPSD